MTTPRSMEVLRFLSRHRRSSGTIASIRDVCGHFGWSSPNAAHSHLRRLETAGLVRRASPGAARSLVITPAGRRALGGVK